METTMGAAGFTPEQQHYLEGFMSGLVVRLKGNGVVPAPSQAPAPALPPAPAPAVSQLPSPDRAHGDAQDRTVASGKKLVDQEKWKRAEHPFDAYARLKDQAGKGEYPAPQDNFRWRFHGLFYVAPAQNSYMCRLRLPNGILKHWQFAGVAGLAERFGGGYAHVTTRGNLQLREITAANAVATLESVQELGLCSRGSGADNIRNVTGGATAGIDPRELLDTRPFARDWHFHILNDRSLYGLPRKFNVGFDGGGAVATLEETNDIGFQAVEVAGSATHAGTPVAPGVWFALMLGGITGHKDLARGTGVIVRPEEATKVADAVVRVFIAEGDRTDRTKARLKYVLDRRGLDTFLAAIEERLGRPLVRVDASFLKPRPAQDRQAHIGVHPQKQDGLNWIGVALPVGKMTAERMRALADIARDCGDGDIRLTVWQNLLISGVPTARVAEAQSRIEAAGLDWRASSLRAGLVACTGNTGCKFAAADTKGHAAAIADWCEGRVALDHPVNIHLTGCHHSCAQHYVGDIGLLGTKVSVSEEGDTVEGYNLVVGGGYGAEARIGREVAADIKAEDTPALVERLLGAYLAHRAGPEESFQTFAARHDVDVLKGFAGARAA